MTIRQILAFMLLALPAWAARTTVTDILYNPSGTRFNGSMYLTSSTSFVASDGNLVVPSQQRIQVTNGVFTVALEPNDTSVPSGTYYVVTYQLQNGLPLVENWVVPTSPTPVSLGAVRTINPPTPGTSIGLSQISLGGASPGQCLTALSSWLPSFACIYWNKYGVDAETNGVTLTAAKMLGGIINGTPTGPASYQSTTAALMVASIPNCLVGTTYDLIIRNTSGGANTITLTTNTGITLAGTMTITQNFSRDFKIRITSCTASSEAATIYGLSEANGGGGGSGCVPAGSSTQVLTDSGSGSCNSTGVTIDGSNNLAVPGTISSGASPTLCSGGTAGCILFAEGSTSTPVANKSAIQANSSTQALEGSEHGAAFARILTASNTVTVTGKSISEAQITFTNITTGNATIAQHGYSPILPNDVTLFYNGIGGFTLPPGSGTTSANGPYYPMGRTPSSGVALFSGDPASAVLIVDQFISNFNKTINTVHVGFGGTLTSGHAFIYGVYNQACTSLLAYGVAVGGGGGTTGSVSITLNTPLSLSFGITYSQAVASEDEVTIYGAAGGVTQGNIMNGTHYQTSTVATFGGAGSTLPSTCPSAGNTYYATTLPNLQN